MSLFDWKKNTNRPTASWFVYLNVTPSNVRAKLRLDDLGETVITGTGTNPITFKFLERQAAPGHGAGLFITFEDGSTFFKRITIPNKNEFIKPDIDVSIKVLPRLIPSGSFFKTGEEKFTIIGVTDFALFKKYLDGKDIVPILHDRTGFNLHRVFLTAKNLFDLDPRNYPDFYFKLQPFCNILARYDRYVEFVVFADAPLVFKSEFEQLNHWVKTRDALRPITNVMLELVNENTQSANTINTSLFQKPDGIISSHGSNSSQETPVRPYWDYETFHTNDAYEWWRKVGHNAMELSSGTEGIDASHVPIVANENTRFPDKDDNINHAYDAAAGAALLIAGATFHNGSGRWSNLFTDREKELAQWWISGAKSVPLDCQDGSYKRRDDLLNDNLRVYQRGDNEQCIVRIRK